MHTAGEGARGAHVHLCLSQIPGNMYGFNSRNETIQLPPREVMPPILRSDDLDVQGIQMFTITGERTN